MILPDTSTASPRRWKLPYPHSFASLVIYTTILALVIGFGSAYWALQGPYPLGKEKAGAWNYWPDIGSSEADPYALAMITRGARLPMSVSEGLELVAATDTAGKPLRSSCSYKISQTVPKARDWTMTIFNSNDGRLIRSDLERSGLTSREILRDENGTFSIFLSRQVQAGNWLQLPDKRYFLVVLRLYDVPASGGRTRVDETKLPVIENLGCER